MLTCKVCGRLYNGCRSRNINNTFRWQDVACSPECGNIYFARILESRKPKDDKENVISADPVIENVVPEDNAVTDDFEDLYAFDDIYEQDEYDDDSEGCFGDDGLI